MPKVPFPHVLTYPANNSHPPRGKVVRIVNDEPIIGFQLQTSVFIGKDIRPATFQISKILLERPAKGDWSAWDKHPHYYECEVKEVIDSRTGLLASDPDYIKKLEKA